MQTAQGNTLLSLDAVDEFLDEHATELASVVATGARQRLKAAIADLATFRSNQSGGAVIARSSTQSKAALRKVLTRDHMAAIARIAKSELALAPEITSLRMPRGRPTIPKLVAAAEGMAKGAAPYISVFTDNGLPKDFIDQLNASAASLLAGATTHKNIQGRRKTATNGLQATLSAGRRIVHVLDSFVQTALKDNPTLLGGWNSVKRVQRTGTRPAATAAPAPVPPAPVNVPAIPASTSSTPTTAASVPAATESPVRAPRTDPMPPTPVAVKPPPLRPMAEPRTRTGGQQR